MPSWRAGVDVVVGTPQFLLAQCLSVLLKGIPKLKTNFRSKKLINIKRYLVLTPKKIQFFFHIFLPFFLSEK